MTELSEDARERIREREDELKALADTETIAGHLAETLLELSE